MIYAELCRRTGHEVRLPSTMAKNSFLEADGIFISHSLPFISSSSVYKPRTKEPASIAMH
jgi:hypothetical protein